MPRPPPESSADGGCVVAAGTGPDDTFASVLSIQAGIDRPRPRPLDMLACARGGCTEPDDCVDVMLSRAVLAASATANADPCGAGASLACGAGMDPGGMLAC
jgi:hypothetical protein